MEDNRERMSPRVKNLESERRSYGKIYDAQFPAGTSFNAVRLAKTRK
jgi:hypothetical protein